MAEGFGEMVIIYNLLPEFAAALEEQVSKVVRKTAFDLAAGAKVAVDAVTIRHTGFLINSIYVVPGGEGGENLFPYSGVQPPEQEGQELLPEVEKPASKTEAIVAVGANYGAYIEYGTTRMPARPYLTPEAEAMRVVFMDALQHIEDKMKAAGGL